MRNNRDIIRLASQKLIDSALRIDAEIMSTTPDVFVKENKINYDLAINTWILACKDYAPYTWTSVLARIQSTGLANTVKLFTDAATVFLDTGDLADFPLARHMLEEIRRTFTHRTLATVEYSTIGTPEGVFLFLCRYLKRFTPLRADKLDAEAKASFLQNQNRLKMIARRGYNEFILNLIRDELDYTLLTSRARSYSSIKMIDIELTPGTCYDLCGGRLTTALEKYRSLIREYNYDTRDVLTSSVWEYQLGETARLTTVPKTFSSARTIAPEECLRQAIAHRMFTLRQRELPGIDLTDQSINQCFAKEGSVTGKWCTIDLSHASDDVTWVLVQEIYRYAPYYLKYLSNIRPRYILVDNKNYVLQSFATMGNSMTFLVESEVFWLITTAAVHYAQRCGIECDDTVVVYGDDIICASEAYAFVVAFLEKMGFSINSKKSFFEGPFRESCGKDYLNGVDVSSPYFPRRSLKTMLDWYRDRNSNLITTAESLIALQHRLYQVSPIASQFIELYIREHRDLGLMPVGTLSTDLWGLDEVVYSTRTIPEYNRKIEEKPRWIFENNSWRYIAEPYTLSRTIVDDEAHTVKYQLRPSVKVGMDGLPDTLLYWLYLAKGPWYKDEFDRLLGISTSRYLMPTGAPRTAWKKFEI